MEEFLMIKERSLATTILLSIVTCGIYAIYFWYTYGEDMNKLCAGDGEDTANYIIVILLGMVTFGIYTFYWQYKMGNRLQKNAPRYGLNFIENGTTILMWALFGSLLCGIGYFIAMNIFIKNMNSIASIYNRNIGAGGGYGYQQQQ